jgi:predicted oxidoreductase
MSVDQFGSADMNIAATANIVNSAPRLLGHLEIGPLGFGCWRLVGHDWQAATKLIEQALDLGMTLIDNADVYGLDWGGKAFGESEILLGNVLAGNPALRTKMVLASKGSILPGVPYVASSDYLRAACEASLARLQTEHIDLYQIHRPDMLTHPAETAEALDQLVQEGKIGMVGVSNYTLAQVRALRAHLKAPLVSLQREYAVNKLDMLREGAFDLCMETGMTPLIWSPLAGGAVVSGQGLPSALIGALDELADRENVDRAAIAIAFILAHPAQCVPLIGSQTGQRLEAICKALSVRLTRGDVYKLIEACEGIALP